MKKCPLCTFQTNYNKEMKEHLDGNHQLHRETRLVQDFLKTLEIEEEVKQEKEQAPEKTTKELYGEDNKYITGKKYTKKKTNKKK